jgi:hypothetical protein
MRKINLLAAAAGLLFTSVVSAQAIRDRNVVPVSVNLNEVSRMVITNGGNIEFVFNSIEDYRQGISSEAASGANNVQGAPAIGNPSENPLPAGFVASSMYLTNFYVASTRRWELFYGAEEYAVGGGANMQGTDNPSNQLALDNVGFRLESNGVHEFGVELTSVVTNDGADIVGLALYPLSLIRDNNDALSSAGDENDNNFTIYWRCGTSEGSMNAVSLLEQNPSPQPDRYITNVLFELVSL